MKTVCVLIVLISLAISVSDATVYSLKSKITVYNDPRVPYSIMGGDLYYYHDDDQVSGRAYRRIDLKEDTATMTEIIDYKDGLRYKYCDSTCNAFYYGVPVEHYRKVSGDVRVGTDTTETGCTRYNRARDTKGSGISSIWFLNDDGRNPCRVEWWDSTKVMKFDTATATIDGVDKATVFAIPSGCPQPTCSIIADVVLVIDDSRSITDTQWTKLKDFVKNFTSALKPSTNTVNIGIVSFSNTAKIVMNISSDLKKIQNAMNFTREKSYTHISAGIDKGVETFKYAPRKSQTGLTRLMFTITDGKANKPCTNGGRLEGSGNNIYCTNNSPQKAINASVKALTTVRSVAIGVGAASYEDLKMIATLGSDDYIITVNDYGDLDGIIKRLFVESCTPAENLPSTDCGADCSGVCWCGNKCQCPATCDKTHEISECHSPVCKGTSTNNGCYPFNNDCSLVVEPDTAQCQRSICIDNKKCGVEAPVKDPLPSGNVCLQQDCDINNFKWISKANNSLCPDKACKINKRCNANTGQCAYDDYVCESKANECKTAACNPVTGTCDYTSTCVTTDLCNPSTCEGGVCTENPKCTDVSTDTCVTYSCDSATGNCLTHKKAQCETCSGPGINAGHCVNDVCTANVEDCSTCTDKCDPAVDVPESACHETKCVVDAGEAAGYRCDSSVAREPETIPDCYSFKCGLDTESAAGYKFTFSKIYLNSEFEPEPDGFEENAADQLANCYKYVCSKQHNGFVRVDSCVSAKPDPCKPDVCNGDGTCGTVSVCPVDKFGEDTPDCKVYDGTCTNDGGKAVCGLKSIVCEGTFCRPQTCVANRDCVEEEKVCKSTEPECKYAYCDLSLDACVEKDRELFSENPCLIPVCENDEISYVEKCHQTARCSVARCSSGECLETGIECGIPDPELSACFYGVCEEEEGCVVLVNRDALFDACGNCVRLGDVNQDTMNVTALEEACVTGMKWPKYATAIAGGALAGVVIAGAIVFLALLIGGAVGTRELIKRSQLAKNTTATNNPLYENAATEGTNPLYVGDDAVL